MSRKERRQAKQDKHAKLKLAAIPVLLAVLGYVLWDGLSGDTKRALPPPQLANSTTPQAPTVAKRPAPAQVNAKTKTPKLPTVDIAALKSRNPFSDYRAKEQSDLEQLDVNSLATTPQRVNPIAEVQQMLANQPVTYRFESAQRKVLVVGDKVIESGRQLSDDVQVEAIQQDRIILTRTEAAGPRRGPAKID